ncbi:hypothetical protein ACOSQ3_005877 [Xanthoceras sorbifolium]
MRFSYDEKYSNAFYFHVLCLLICLHRMEKLRPTTWALPAAVLLLIIISNMFCPTTSATYMVGGGRSTWNASSNIQAWSSNKNFYAGDAVGCSSLDIQFLLHS